MITETVYSGRDNRVTFVVRQNAKPLDFSGATRMVLSLAGHGDIDSDIDASAIDWSEGDGRVALTLGHLNIPPRSYAVSLVVFDPEHLQGQVLIHADDRIGPVGHLTIRVLQGE